MDALSCQNLRHNMLPIQFPKQWASFGVFLLLVSCGQHSQDDSLPGDTSGSDWPGFRYDLDPSPSFSTEISSRNTNTECSVVGSSLEDAIERYASQCSLPRVDCDPQGSQWVCSSRIIDNGSPATSAGSQPAYSPLPGPYVSPSYSPQPVDPASWSYQEVYQKEGYELVFSDEFDGSEINPQRWSTQLRWDGEFNGSWYEYRVINGEKQFYVNVLTEDGEHRDKLLSHYNPFSFDGSRIAIRAVANPFLENRQATIPTEHGRGKSYGRFEPLLKRQPFLSGALSTHGKFSQKFGYFEARIRIPSHPGTFPAFWLYHQRERWEDTRRSEIDIMENLGHDTRYVYNSFHYFDNVSVFYPGDLNFLKPEPNGQISIGENFSDDYHVYAVDWRPGTITWYIDGEPVSQINHPNVDNEELYLILNLAIGGNWVNYPESAGGLGRADDQLYPTIDEQRPEVFGNPELEIDYVRVYQKKS